MNTSTHKIIRIGEWLFSPETGTLTEENHNNRLENRASALLEYFCQRPGELVSHGEIIEHVWDGRFVSPNSVAVVISDIRRALGDEARNPTYIETLPKRGYRLIADVDMDRENRASSGPADITAPQKTSIVRPRLGAVILGLMVVSVLTFFAMSKQKPSQTMKVFTGVVINETKDEAYDALSTAVTELLSVEVSRHDKFSPADKPDASIIVTGNLILWDGHPSVSLHAVSATNGEALWSGMASGPETLLPKQVRAEIAELADQFPVK